MHVHTITEGTVAVSEGAQIGDSTPLRDSFRRSVLAQNKAPRTIATYVAAVDMLGSFLAAQGMPQTLAHVRREHVEHWVTTLLASSRPATVSVRCRAVQQGPSVTGTVM